MSKFKERLTVWRRAGDIVLPFDSLDRSLFPVRDLAPYSIFPIAEGARVRLASGAMRLLALLNVSMVLRYFASRGWAVVKTAEQHLEEADETGVPALATVRKGRFWTTLSVQLFARLALEGLRPRALLQMCEQLASLDESGDMDTYPVFRDEADVWD